MAEIRVERKRGASPLIWILLLLIIAAAVAAYFYMQPRTDTPPQTQTAPVTQTWLSADADQHVV